MIKEKNKDKNVAEDMFEIGAHFGYDRSRTHPSAKPFIFGRKNNFELFDLEKTVSKMQSALDFVSKLASEGKQVLFVGSKKEAEGSIKNSAEKIDMPYVNSRWIGGTLTNFEQIRKRVTHYLDLVSQKEKGELAKYTKKERLLIDRDIEKLDKKFSGISNMVTKPGAIFLIDANNESIARDEAILTGVPVIALCGTDNDFTKINYPIPANDSSIKSIKYFIEKIVEAYETGVSAKKLSN